MQIITTYIVEIPKKLLESHQVQNKSSENAYYYNNDNNY